MRADEYGRKSMSHEDLYQVCTLSMTYCNESQLHKNTYKNLESCRKKRWGNYFSMCVQISY